MDSLTELGVRYWWVWEECSTSPPAYSAGGIVMKPQVNGAWSWTGSKLPALRKALD